MVIIIIINIIININIINNIIVIIINIININIIINIIIIIIIIVIIYIWRFKRIKNIFNFLQNMMTILCYLNSSISSCMLMAIIGKHCQCLCVLLSAASILQWKYKQESLILKKTIRHQIFWICILTINLNPRGSYLKIFSDSSRPLCIFLLSLFELN